MLIAGVDEVGRGPLAGPVVAAAVILPESHGIIGLNDSKLLTAKKRNHLIDIIKEKSISWALGRAEVEEIDTYNIHHASLLAMKRAIEQLSQLPDEAWIDGKFIPKVNIPCQAFIGGDKLKANISAASIIAKVTRDAEMIALDEQYPGYGFASNKGYPSKGHLQALQELGITPIHRRSYRPVRELLTKASS